MIRRAVNLVQLPYIIAYKLKQFRGCLSENIAIFICALTPAVLPRVIAFSFCIGGCFGASHCNIVKLVDRVNTILLKSAAVQIAFPRIGLLNGASISKMICVKHTTNIALY